MSLEYFSEIGGGLATNCVILSGSPNSNRLETSERETTSALWISAAVIFPGIVAPCSVFDISGCNLAGVVILAIMSSVS